jgi:outer membrane lipoprotein SlyB
MARWSVVALLFFVACASSKPAPPPVDPAVEATIVGAIEEAAIQGTVEGAEGARIGRRVGIVAGVIAAVVGGPETESLDDVVDRYRDTRDAIQTTATVIAATHGAVEGAKRGYELDLQFAELTRIAGVEAFRPYPDLIEVRFTDQALVPEIARVLAGREGRAVTIEAAGDEAMEVRDALLELDAPGRFNAVRNNDLAVILMRIEYF